LTNGLQLAKNLPPAGRPTARRHDLVSPGDFVGIRTAAEPSLKAAALIRLAPAQRLLGLAHGNAT
jgi:hypothetical protein